MSNIHDDFGTPSIQSMPSRRRKRRLQSDSSHPPVTTTESSQSQQPLPDVDTPSIVTPTAATRLHMVPLYRGHGTYYMDLWCGTPVPQHQTMIVDTGSSTSAMTCDPECPPSRCGRIQQYHPVFRPQQSVTYRKVTQCTDCTATEECVPVVHDRTHPYEDNDRINNATDSSAGSQHHQEIMEYECVWSVAYQEGSRWTAFAAIDTCSIMPSHPTNHHPSFSVRYDSVPVTPRSVSSSSSSSSLTYQNSSIDVDSMDGGNNTFQLRFGCQTALSGNFRTQDTSGILGLKLGSSTALWNQMHQQGILSRRAFSICIIAPSRYAATTTTTSKYHSTPSGIMTFGGTYTPLHRHTMVYAQMMGNGLYQIRLQNIYLRPATTTNGAPPSDPLVLQKVLIPQQTPHDTARTVIIDSGTTDSYFAEELGEPFRNAWLELYGVPFTNEPMSLSDDEMNQLPTIVLQFQGHTDSNVALQNDPTASEYVSTYVDIDHPYDILVAVPPSIYMEYENGMYTANIFFDEPEGNVFGANLMSNHDVHFDIELYRIGFAESACNDTLSVRLSSSHSDPVDPIHSTGAASRPTTLTAASSSQFPSLHLDDSITLAFTTIEIWQPIAFLVFLVSILGMIRFVLSRRKAGMNSTIAVFNEVPKIRRGRRRRQPQQDQPIMNRMRMVARSISRDSVDFVRSMSQSRDTSPPSPSSRKYSNISPARRQQSFMENTKMTFGDHDTDVAVVVGHNMDKETTSKREVRRGANVLRSRSNQFSFRDNV